MKSTSWRAFGMMLAACPLGAAAQALVFQMPVDGPPSGFAATATPGTGAPVTVTYTDNGPRNNPGGQVDGWPYFKWARGGPGSYFYRPNAFGAFFGTSPGGIATWTFSQPVVGDVATQRTRFSMSQEMQFASYRITLDGGAVWSAAPQRLFNAACPPGTPQLVQVTGQGSSTLNFMRPAGSTQSGCDDFYLEATGPITAMHVEAMAPVSGTLNGQPFMPVDELRLYMGVQDATASTLPTLLSLYPAPAASPAAGGVAAVPALDAAGLGLLGGAMGGIGALGLRARRRAARAKAPQPRAPVSTR